MGELLRALIVDETRASLVDVLSALDDSCGYEARFAVASNETELRQELAVGAWDVILAQRVAPTLGALRILELVRTRTPRIPVVVYSEKHTEAELVCSAKVSVLGAESSRPCIISRILVLEPCREDRPD